METITEKANNAAKAENKDFAYVEAILSDGTPVKVAKSSVERIIRNIVSNSSMSDNVFVMYHSTKDLFQLVRPYKWVDIQKQGGIADGVAVYDGQKYLVVAVSSSVSMKWSSEFLVGGGYSTTKAVDAIKDFDGQKNTTALIAHPQCIAADFCAKYSHGSLTAGKWWLPSVGELTVIYSNLSKINYALSLIDGATQISDTGYLWSSTEFSNANAWFLRFSDGRLGEGRKAEQECPILPVSVIQK